MNLHEVNAQVSWFEEMSEPISDAVAQEIARLYNTPSSQSEHINHLVRWGEAKEGLIEAVKREIREEGGSRELSALLAWAEEKLPEVTTSEEWYGHYFPNEDGECADCGARFGWVRDDGEPSHIYYVGPVHWEAKNTEGDVEGYADPEYCPGEGSDRVHGHDTVCMMPECREEEDPCVHEDHECNCLLCD